MQHETTMEVKMTMSWTRQAAAALGHDLGDFGPATAGAAVIDPEPCWMAVCKSCHAPAAIYGSKRPQTEGAATTHRCGDRRMPLYHVDLDKYEAAIALLYAAEAELARNN